MSAPPSAPGVLPVLTGEDVADAGFIAAADPAAARPWRAEDHRAAPALSRATRALRWRGTGRRRRRNARRPSTPPTDRRRYDDLPVVISFDDALGAERRHPRQRPGQCLLRLRIRRREADRGAVARADVVSVTVDSPRVAPTPMEVRGAIASYDAATDSLRYLLPQSGRAGAARRARHEAGIAAGESARAHGRCRRRLRRAHRAFPEYPVLLYAAKKLGRPVKWLSTRTEDFLTDNHGRAISLRGELAFNSNGRFLALRTDWLCDSGAYLGEPAF